MNVCSLYILAKEILWTFLLNKVLSTVTRGSWTMQTCQPKPLHPTGLSWTIDAHPKCMNSVKFKISRMQKNCAIATILLVTDAVIAIRRSTVASLLLSSSYTALFLIVEQEAEFLQVEITVYKSVIEYLQYEF